MKYIRTENGIEKLDADREHLTEYMNGKQADTIEELCDYWDFYDLVDNSYEIRPIDIYSVYIMKRSLLEEKSASDIKLAIRTDKGLIFVAKMNDKGELELL